MCYDDIPVNVPEASKLVIAGGNTENSCCSLFCLSQTVKSLMPMMLTFESLSFDNPHLHNHSIQLNINIVNPTVVLNILLSRLSSQLSRKHLDLVNLHSVNYSVSSEHCWHKNSHEYKLVTMHDFATITQMQEFLLEAVIQPFVDRYCPVYRENLPHFGRFSDKIYDYILGCFSDIVTTLKSITTPLHVLQEYLKLVVVSYKSLSHFPWKEFRLEDVVWKWDSARKEINFTYQVWSGVIRPYNLLLQIILPLILLIVVWVLGNAYYEEWQDRSTWMVENSPITNAGSMPFDAVIYANEDRCLRNTLKALHDSELAGSKAGFLDDGIEVDYGMDYASCEESPSPSSNRRKFKGHRRSNTISISQPRVAARPELPPRIPTLDFEKEPQTYTTINLNAQSFGEIVQHHPNTEYIRKHRRNSFSDYQDIVSKEKSEVLMDDLHHGKPANSARRKQYGGLPKIGRRRSRNFVQLPRENGRVYKLPSLSDITEEDSLSARSSIDWTSLDIRNNFEDLTTLPRNNSFTSSNDSLNGLSDELQDLIDRHDKVSTSSSREDTEVMDNQSNLTVLLDPQTQMSMPHKLGLTSTTNSEDVQTPSYTITGIVFDKSPSISPEVSICCQSNIPCLVTEPVDTEVTDTNIATGAHSTQSANIQSQESELTQPLELRIDTSHNTISKTKLTHNSIADNTEVHAPKPCGREDSSLREPCEPLWNEIDEPSDHDTCQLTPTGATPVTAINRTNDCLTPSSDDDAKDNLLSGVSYDVLDYSRQQDDDLIQNEVFHDEYETDSEMGSPIAASSDDGTEPQIPLTYYHRPFDTNYGVYDDNEPQSPNSVASSDGNESIRNEFTKDFDLLKVQSDVQHYLDTDSDVDSGGWSPASPDSDGSYEEASFTRFQQDGHLHDQIHDDDAKHNVVETLYGSSSPYSDIPLRSYHTEGNQFPTYDISALSRPPPTPKLGYASLHNSPQGVTDTKVQNAMSEVSSEEAIHKAEQMSPIRTPTFLGRSTNTLRLPTYHNSEKPVISYPVTKVQDSEPIERNIPIMPNVQHILQPRQYGSNHNVYHARTRSLSPSKSNWCSPSVVFERNSENHAKSFENDNFNDTSTHQIDGTRRLAVPVHAKPTLDIPVKTWECRANLESSRTNFDSD